MKRLLYAIWTCALLFVYVSCNKEDYTILRISAPETLSATRGDTSVFLKWSKVDGAEFYTLVRGLKTIADSLKVENYVDNLAPDTLTEYRVYAVDALGWRSLSYASDSGYMGIPEGVIPRAPIKFEASTNDIRGCVLSWTNGRFATSYKLYKDGVFYTEVKGNQFIDYEATEYPVDYTLYSNNYNGTSISGISAVGQKAFLCFDDYENYVNASVLQPWTEIADRTQYYTEGNPKIIEGGAFSGTKQLVINGGKVQILHDWGGAQYEGYYVISFMARKDNGSFNVNSTFGTNEVYSNIGQWKRFSYKTNLIKVGGTFSLTIESKSDAMDLYIDDLSISYVYENQ